LYSSGCLWHDAEVIKLKRETLRNHFFSCVEIVGLGSRAAGR
jgi:hypothetical protein